MTSWKRKDSNQTALFVEWKWYTVLKNTADPAPTVDKSGSSPFLRNFIPIHHVDAYNKGLFFADTN